MKHPGRIVPFLLVFAVIGLCIFFAPINVSAATSGNYTYTVSNGNATITECKTTVSGSITIPTTLGGYPVTAIGTDAFRNCSNLTSVTIPNGVISIGEYAFYACENLSSVTIADSVTSIDKYAFAWCISLTDVKISNNVTRIDRYAFGYCKSLTSVVIPDSVTVLGDSAFWGCSTLSDVTLSNNLKYISWGTFCGTKITEIDIPNSVTSIGGQAFRNCTKLTNVTIPGSVTTIASEAFTGCTGLNRVTIPNSVTTIQGAAFDGCTNLYKVIYCGTEEQWNEISIEYSNTSLTRATRYYHNWNPATCTDPKICSICGAREGDVVHTWADATCTTLATCIYCGATEGSFVHTWSDATCTAPATCVLCGATEGETNPLNHFGDHWFEIIEPNCTEDGLKARICDGCGITETTAIPALGHDYQIQIIDPTCTERGYNLNTCCICGDFYKDSYVDTKSHNYNSVTTLPTCTEQGYTTNTCVDCGGVTVADYVEAKGHSFGDWTEIVAPGCTAAGMKARMCGCGETETQTVEAAGHSYTSVITAPTCTEQGYTTNTCSVCDNVTITEYLDAKGHSFGDWTEIVAPDCTAEGMKARMCGCGETETQPVDALGHTCDSVVTAPTCTEQGYTTNTCTACGDVTVTDYVDAKGHGWSAWIQIKAPTCETEGSQLHFCNCGTKETQSIEKLPHNYVNGICSACDYTMSGYVVLSADMDLTNLDLTEDLYIDLNGYVLSGIITTNGYKVYGMDSTTNEYTCDSMGYFSCVDEDGNAVIPEKLYTTEDMMRYMTIGTESGYTFHRYYLGITNLSLAPAVTGFGYKAEFYGDEMVQEKIAVIGFNLWLDSNKTVSYTTDFKNSLTLRLENFDVVNYGQTPVNANVIITLTDGTVIESSTASYSMRQMVEIINKRYKNLNETQLSAIQTLITNNPVMQSWQVENIFKKS